MNAKEAVEATVETVAQSVVEAPLSTSGTLGVFGVGTLTGSGLLQIFAGIISLLIMINTVFMIRLNRARLKNEKSKD